MADVPQNQYLPSEVSPPGETLREILADRGLTQSEVAARMGRPLKTISEIVTGKAAITPETALEFELVLGIPADFWNTREKNYRAFLARREQEERLRDNHAWCRRFPLTIMRRHEWLKDTKGSSAGVRELLAFFGVASPEQWEATYRTAEVAFRRPARFAPDRFALAAWLRRGLQEAERVRTVPYTAAGFLQALAEVRSLTREPPHVFCGRMTELCARQGVVVALVPELPKSRASGATRWLGSDRALIQLSLRYKTDDHFWFTFFHEAAHIVLHPRRAIFIEDHRSDRSEDEQEANQWAADLLIPPAALREFLEAEDLCEEAIASFADRIGIAHGIVVGRLQHEGLVPHSFGYGLKRRLEWAA